MVEILHKAFNLRSTPITEPGIPTHEVYGNYAIRFLKLTSTDFIITYQLGADYKFYVQAFFCSDDPKASLSEAMSDATILGQQESAETFYTANYSFFAPMSAHFASCMPEGMELHYDRPEPLSRNEAHSEERVLRHMSNWLLFFAKFQNDSRRSAQWLPFILAKYKQLLMQTDIEGDLQSLAGKIKLFDKMFSFSVFDLNLPIDEVGRNSEKQFFETMLLMRRKLAPFSPEVAAHMTRDEALLKSLQ
jgi:hypothetical protein